MRVLLQPAFVLHHRAYRETSLLVEILTEEYGRLTLLAKGVRTPRSSQRSLLQPFIPLLLSWQGRSELMTLTSIETKATPLQLSGDCLLSGLYLNELLVRVLQKQDPHPNLFSIYQQTLIDLQQRNLDEKILRKFEKKLLVELGYGIEFHTDFQTGDSLRVEENYQYYPEQGFALCKDPSLAGSAYVFSGKSLLAFANELFEEEGCLKDAKRLMRILFMPILGSQPIVSRKLFI